MGQLIITADLTETEYFHRAYSLLEWRTREVELIASSLG